MANEAALSLALFFVTVWVWEKQEDGASGLCDDGGSGSLRLDQS